ncbi:ABC transporter G family member 24 [Tetrabaena socialis]|uniref:ABC transporter G family member 24 n=1 Tax=Tetrabaena socialis TaxID=47790 RepID=A0A2J8A548_9CHLO|nr:ABC transporter G family member 24 [Tetrabaena socialis]|eukprot:PNH07625.1 ABC transporter G family member 24 [Tetrabaena socialis]
MATTSSYAQYSVGTVERRGISGGQRKRVNIGLELVAMPSLLFLDEPTSGLDATSSADILSALADMANLGMNIITVIHQPRFSSFLMFDQVLLLGTGGRTVYLGSPSAAMLYFTKFLGFRFPDRENPADILMDIIAGKVPCAEDPK